MSQIKWINRAPRNNGEETLVNFAAKRIKYVAWM